jgi:hypothetical protein
VSSGTNDDSTVLELQVACAGNAQDSGRAMESSRTYLQVLAARGLDAELNAKASVSDLVQDTLLEAYPGFGTVAGAVKGPTQGRPRPRPSRSQIAVPGAQFHSRVSDQINPDVRVIFCRVGQP